MHIAASDIDSEITIGGESPKRVKVNMHCYQRYFDDYPQNCQTINIFMTGINPRRDREM